VIAGAQPATTPPRPGTTPPRPAATTAPPTRPANAKAPTAVILFLDRATVLRQSTVGKDMSAQVEAMVKKMEADFAPENKKLQADVQALQSQAAVLAPDVRQQKIKDLEARRQAFQKKVQDRQASIQAGLAQARTKVEQALGPILEKIMVERGANLLLDRGLVVLGATDLDVTATVIGRLNTSLPKVAVTLVKPPPRPPGAAAPPPARPPGR
jgi:Skp family chaperone for outer membrane proteins